MINFSPQDLSHREVKACTKALAVMVYRFEPIDNNHFYSAQKISEQVGDLPNGQMSTLYVEPDTLKKALANQRLRDGLLHLLPGKIVFDRSSSRFNTITEGPYYTQSFDAVGHREGGTNTVSRTNSSSRTSITLRRSYSL